MPVIKDIDGNITPYQKASESRRLVWADADGLGFSFPSLSRQYIG